MRRAVGELLGVYDAPDWLAAELLGDLGEWGRVDEELARRLVLLNSPRLSELLRRNLDAFRPGRSSIRRAAPFLTAELIESWGIKPLFVKFEGLSVPAVPRHHGLATPIVPIVEAKRPLLYKLSAMSKFAGSFVVLSAVDGVPGVRVEVEKLKRPPYYYAMAEGLRDAVERAGAMRLPADKAAWSLYQFWREHRARGFLVLAGREVAGVKVDLLAVGLGRYGAVVGASGRKINRLSKYLDSVVSLKP